MDFIRCVKTADIMYIIDIGQVSWILVCMGIYVLYCWDMFLCFPLFFGHPAKPNNYRIIRRTQNKTHCEIGSARQFTGMPVHNIDIIILCRAAAVRLHYLDQGERSSSWSLAGPPAVPDSAETKFATIIIYIYRYTPYA